MKKEKLLKVEMNEQKILVLTELVERMNKALVDIIYESRILLREKMFYFRLFCGMSLAFLLTLIAFIAK